MVTRRALLSSALAAGVAGTIAMPEPAHAAPLRQVSFRAWDSGAAFGAGGDYEGVTVVSDGLTIGTPVQRFWYAGREYETARWTTPWIDLDFGLTELVASWNAVTPPGTWIEVAARGYRHGSWTGWFILGRWTAGDGAADIRRASLDGQSTTAAKVNTDTLVTQNGYAFPRYQLQARLMRPVGSGASPKIRLLGGVASRWSANPVPTSQGRLALGTVLPVPTYSQETHAGHFPEYNGGGEAWCSATSTAMVLDYWRMGPDAATIGWVLQRYPGERRPQVDHAARQTYDYVYGGTGNWPFNAAYAASRGLRAYVTRLRTLNEAEQYIAAGIPLIVSVSFSSSQLTGAGYSTNGHLLVIVGFTSTGDVVVNDPASHLRADDNQVRFTYRRAQFENVWIPKGGIAYVYAPWGRTMPQLPADRR